MRFLKIGAASPRPEANVAVKAPVLEGWSERDLVSVYEAAPVRQLAVNEPLMNDIESSESFFVLLSGALQVVVKWDGHRGRPGIIRRGDCLAPLPKSPGLLYSSQASEPCTIIEITPTVMKYLPDKAQLSIYRTAVSATSRINAYIRAVNGEVSAKNTRLASYISEREAARHSPSAAVLTENFLRNLPRIPSYAMDLSVKLLQERTTVQEVVETIKRDPSVAALVLSVVNSAQYGFGRKIETFYHACIVLGFNNIYTLILREAVQAAMPVTQDTRRVHAHSCLISVLCHEVATAARDANAQTAATVGLLHDIGKGARILMQRANPTVADYVGTFNSARIGATLLRSWGVPERVCTIVEVQEIADYTAPDLIDPEYLYDVGVLHVAHVLESLLTQQPDTPSSTIYTKDHMAILGLPAATPEAFLAERVLPNLVRNLNKLPREIHDIIASASR